MPRRIEDPHYWDRLRQKILGLGEDSIHKSYFAELQLRIQQLEASERKFAVAFQASPAMMGISRLPEGHLLEANPAWFRAFGWTQEEAIGRTIRDLGIWPDLVHRLEFLAQLREAGSIALVEKVFLRKDGSPMETLGSMTIVEIDGQACILMVGTDVTEQKQAARERERLQSQLIQAQKMDAIGQLAGGVAHDFNNLLTIINLNAEMLASEQDPPSCELQEILLAASRAQDLTRQLLTFGRRRQMAPQLCELNAVVAETVKLLRRLIGEQIRLEVALADAPTPVMADPGQIAQVMMNLAINARDAMPSGGRLLVETWPVRIEEHHRKARHQNLPPGDYVALALADTGCGMDEATLNHIFEPFFTTKEKGKGTGLGLATVYGIVRQSGGHIWVYSEPGHGTQFKIYLPLAATGEPGAEAHPAPAHRLGSETILLVEDDTVVRTLIQGALAGWGYHVVSAGDPLEALELAAASREPIHLLVSDMVMPHMNGLALARSLLGDHPETRVLFISGYTDGAASPSEGRLEGCGFLQKPFNMRDLNLKVRELLDAPPLS